MALYTIGDLHLSLGSDKPMDIFGEGWSNYVERIREGFSELGSEDVTVLCGDLSWGMSLEESLQDLTFIHELPGKKILMKGNHDYWWNTAAKMQRFFDEHGLVLRAGGAWRPHRENAQPGGRAAGDLAESSRGEGEALLPTLSAPLHRLSL